jgi:hypothetical protein
MFGILLDELCPVDYFFEGNSKARGAAVSGCFFDRRLPKMAVPAQELRLRGARSTAELALAGTFLLVLDGVLRLDDVWAPTPPSTLEIIHLRKYQSTTFCDGFDKNLD